jgi:sugar lactone lactonase YvrE
MFYIDTPTRTIDAFDFDAATGSIANRRTIVVIEPGVGWPDGMTIDVEGGLWVALWGGSAIRRYVDGVLDRVVVLPVMKPTSCAFGGTDLDELYVTSAWEEHTAAERRADPLAGAVLRLRPGVRGVPPAVVTTI